MAQELLMKTILSSTRAAEKTGKHPADLGNIVTLPGGTTSEALLQLETARFRSLFVEAVPAARRKDEPFNTLGVA